MYSSIKEFVKNKQKIKNKMMEHTLNRAMFFFLECAGREGTRKVQNPPSVGRSMLGGRIKGQPASCWILFTLFIIMGRFFLFLILALIFCCKSWQMLGLKSTLSFCSTWATSFVTLDQYPRVCQIMHIVHVIIQSNNYALLFVPSYQETYPFDHQCG